MSGRDWRAFDAELRARVPELAVELLGKPTFRAGQEWRWGRKGSLSVVVGGARAGMWFDHEEGRGGWFSDLVGRDLGMAREDATDWIADRIGMGARHLPVGRSAGPSAMPANDPSKPKTAPTEALPENHPSDPTALAPNRSGEAAERATRIWTSARPAPQDHPYLVAKRATPLALRMDASRRLLVPLQDIDGQIHSVEFIAPDGAKRYLAGGAKKGHFAVVGAEPGPLAVPHGPVLICEGWATGASLHMATGETVVAAMDAGNLMPVAEALRARLPDADRTAPLAMEEHADPIAEAVRWSICEGELIQAMGRGRGVNRTTVAPLEIDLLTDVVLPVTVDALVPWSELRPRRRDLMALSGIVLENAADMAACFPDLWPSAAAARQDRSRSVTNCYYRDLYNSQMSHSSVEVTYRPEGRGQRARTARIDLVRIPDPEVWLTNRLGPLAQCDIAAPTSGQAHGRERLDALGARLTASMHALIAARRAALDALSARLEAVAPVDLHQSPTRNHKEED